MNWCAIRFCYAFQIDKMNTQRHTLTAQFNENNNHICGFDDGHFLWSDADCNNYIGARFSTHTFSQ